MENGRRLRIRYETMVRASGLDDLSPAFVTFVFWPGGSRARAYWSDNYASGAQRFTRVVTGRISSPVTRSLPSGGALEMSDCSVCFDLLWICFAHNCSHESSSRPGRFIKE